MLGALTHVRQSPVPCASGVQVLRVDARPVVADAHAKLPCTVRDFRFDVTGVRVAERIAQGFAGDALDVVADDRMQVPR